VATETWELTVSGYAGPENNTVVMHYNSDNVAVSDTAHDGEDLISSWETNLRAKFLDLLPATYFLDYIRARRVIPKFSAVAHVQYPFRNKPGTLGANLASNQLCPVIKLIPPTGIKSAGKIFLPAVGGGEIVNNQYDAGYVTRVNTFMTAATANFGTGTLHWQVAIYSRKNNSASLALAWSLSPVIGYQKRRRSPVG
jgi:hypothetical protein